MTTASQRMGALHECVATTRTEQKICPDHGKYKSLVMLYQGRPFGKPTNCPQCRELQEKKEQELSKIKNIEQKLSAANLPKAFEQATFENYEISNEQQKKAFYLAKKYANEFKTVLKHGINLIFCGKPGTGKTHLAAAIAHHIIIQGYSVSYKDAYLMIDTIRNTKHYTIDESIKALSNIDLLIIDEVGDQVRSEAELRLFNKLIDARYTNKKPNLIISNLPWTNADKSLRETLGPRIRSRLSENDGKIIAFNWEDYRQQKKTNFWS